MGRLYSYPRGGVAVGHPHRVPVVIGEPVNGEFDYAKLGDVI